MTDHHDTHQHEQQGFFQRFKGIIILLVVILVVSFFCGLVPFGLPQLLESVGLPKAIRPEILLPAEPLTPTLTTIFGEEVKLTNTIVAVILADIVLLLAAIVARIGLREVPRGFSNLFEMLVEFLHDLSVQVVGAKWGPRIFPIAGTIFIFLLVANWMHFIPGFDSVGKLEHPHVGEGYEIGSWNGILYMIPPDAVAAEGGEAEPAEAEEHAEEAAEGEEHAEETACGVGDHCIVVPYARAAATDINVPLALAIVSFTTIQVFGSLGLGWGYLGKFINTNGLAKGGMGIMDFGVGLFELVLEPVKIISLTFRLLGNIFGGGILLAVVSSLIAFLVPVGLYMFELFVGAIQAYVFAMLTLVFSAMAMAGHGGDH